MSDELVYEIDGERKAFKLDKQEITVGRDELNDLVIDRLSISRRHARFYREGDDWHVTDLGSLNGTRINQLDHTDKVLVDGDRVYLYDLALTFTRGSNPRVSLTPSEELGEVPYSQTVVQEAVDFSVLAGRPPDVSHLQTLLAVVTKASEAILAAASLNEALNRVLDLVFEHLQVERGVIMLWSAEEQDLVPRCARHRGGQGGPEIRFSRTIAERVYRDKVSVLTSDAQLDRRFAQVESVFELDIHSAMAAPLWRGDEVDGLIYVDARRRKAFDEFDLDLLSALGNHLAVAIERSRLEQSVLEQRLRRRRLERYHSPAVIERITRGLTDGDSTLVAEEREVTVLFADVVGFTRRCEGMEPREVAELLNRYFSEMADMVFRHEGTLDKFIGDCVMAVFGAPFAAADHARRAAEAALDMREALDILNAPLPESERLQFRVGIHCGRVVAGDIGSLRRSDYTVLGATVNLASRLESAVAQPGQIVISDVVCSAIGDGYETRPVGEHQPKGVSSKITCYELRGRRAG